MAIAIHSHMFCRICQTQKTEQETVQVYGIMLLKETLILALTKHPQKRSEAK